MMDEEEIHKALDDSYVSDIDVTSRADGGYEPRIFTRFIIILVKRVSLTFITYS